MAQQTIPFMDLSPETRNIIYNLVAGQKTQIHVKRNQRKFYDKARFASHSRLGLADHQCHRESYEKLQEHAFTTARSIIFDVIDLDFRQAILFIKNLKEDELAKLHLATAPKLVIRLEVKDVKKFSGEKLGAWFKFCKTCDFEFGYEVGKVGEKELNLAVTFFMRLGGLSENAEYQMMSRIVWDWREGLERTKSRGSMLGSLYSEGDAGATNEEDDEEGEDRVDSGEDGAGDQGDEEDEDDSDPENMSSEDDFTDDEDDDEDDKDNGDEE